jgi:predicted nucleotidyltransferase
MNALPVKEKVERHVSGRLVEYSEARWALLEGLRERAVTVQDALPTDSLVYGSVARGDVVPGSDIDVVLMGEVTSYAVELALGSDLRGSERRITIASPNSVPKAIIELGQGTSVSWPLLPPTEREEEFYRFGGAIDAAGTRSGERVAGVSKRLLLVEPGEEGHLETSVPGLEVDVARRLGVPLDVVDERVRVLTRRDAIGRTGVFRSVSVGEGMTFEQALDAMAYTTPAVRRQLRLRKDGR